MRQVWQRETVKGPGRSPRRAALARGLRAAALAASAVGIVTPGSALAAGEPSAPAPLLRVETAMHTGAITALASDRAGAVLLTASLDGTARLWDAASGALRRTLRPPQGATPGDGWLFAAALSTDGRLAALGGYTRYFDLSRSMGSSVYLFDTRTGALQRRVAGLHSRTGYPAADVVTDLRLYPDNAAEAELRLATARSDAGAALFLVGSGAPLTAIGPGATALDGTTVDVDGAGRLALAAADGALRLYDGGLRLLREARLPAGSRPLRLRFSPDGGRLAVLTEPDPRAPRDVPPVSQLLVLSAPDLAVQTAQPWPGGAERGGLAWLPGTQRLCVGGNAAGDGNEGAPLLRCWEAQGRGAARDLGGALGATGTVRALLGLPGGALAWATEEPAFGVLEADGRRRLLKRPAFTDLGRPDLLTPAQRESALRVDASGALVEWPLVGGPADAQRARYAVAQGVLRVLPAVVKGDAGADEGLRPALTQPPGKPQRPPKHQEQRPPRALAYRPDGDGYLAGWDGHLRGFNRDGLQRFAAPTPAPVQALTVSGDSQVAVAALADGTLRWYRVKTGDELLALFVHPDRRRWVAFTPAGTYDASIDGEALAGWHLNPTLEEEARFVPLSQLRQAFYRPSRVAAALGPPPGPGAQPKASATPPALRGEDPRAPTPPDGRRSEALARHLPPRVRIDKAAPLQVVGGEVKLQVAAPPGAALRFLINGREVRGAQVAPTRGVDNRGAAPLASDNRGAAPLASDNRGAERSAIEAVSAVRLPLAPSREPRTLTVLATGAEGAGEPAEVTIQPQPEVPEEERPRLWLLTVGVSRYARPALAMTPGLAASDASQLAKTLLAQRGRLYRDAEARVLTDAEATRDRVLDGLEWLARQATARDVAVVQLAGHGVNDPETGQYYFLPHDADPEHLLRTGVAGPTLQSALAAIPGRVVLLLDTCHAGNATGRGSGDFTRFVNELSGTERGVVVMTSALGRQLAQESPEWGHGAFTLALLEGLRGKADFRRSGRITLAALDLYVSDRVRELTGGAQTPVLARPITVPDFPLVQLP